MSVAIIINSCLKYYKTTIPVIINSAKKAKIPSNNIYIVVGECDEESKIIRNNDYNIIFCKYCNIDHNAILYFTQTQEGVNELKKYTHFFYMHDTSEFKNDFYDNMPIIYVILSAGALYLQIQK